MSRDGQVSEKSLGEIEYEIEHNKVPRDSLCTSSRLLDPGVLYIRNALSLNSTCPRPLAAWHSLDPIQHACSTRVHIDVRSQVSDVLRQIELIDNHSEIDVNPTKQADNCYLHPRADKPHLAR